LQGHQLYPIAAVPSQPGARRGELLAIQLGDLDFDGASLRIERSLEETAAGLRFKPPKTQHGRRTISLPAHTIAVLRSHWRQQLEYRMAAGAREARARRADLQSSERFGAFARQLVQGLAPGMSVASLTARDVSPLCDTRMRPL